MRLIDADALIDDLKHDVAVDQDSLDYEELTDLNRENIQFDKDCKQYAIDLLQHAPTIEPQRKKGRWIKKTIKKKIENDYSCSECGRHVSVMRGYDVRLVYPFCHCGADMTEGEG